MVDLRSDTVSRPSAAMREVMKVAEVGDDVLGDDPTVLKLQDMGAKMLGKEAALFVPSGTMSNAVAIKTHTQPGDEIITESGSHIYLYEGGGYAALSGCSIKLIEGVNGTMSSEQVAMSVRKAAGSQSHFPDASLVCLENTTNKGGGVCWEQDSIDSVALVAHERDCAVHMDGARLFNASVNTGIDVERIVRDCDSVSVCLSKGLGAPVGSLLAGSQSFIDTAHRWRKMFGGGMRQSGVLAAAGIFALENNIDRLREDHVRIKKLASELDEMQSFSVDMDTVQTNIVYIDVDKSRFSSAEVVESLAASGVDLFATDSYRLRAVTHLDVDDDGINQAIEAFAELDKS